MQGEGRGVERRVRSARGAETKVNAERLKKGVCVPFLMGEKEMDLPTEGATNRDWERQGEEPRGQSRRRFTTSRCKGWLERDTRRTATRNEDIVGRRMGG